jgi:hypothetical protein
MTEMDKSTFLIMGSCLSIGIVARVIYQKSRSNWSRQKSQLWGASIGLLGATIALAVCNIYLPQRLSILTSIFSIIGIFYLMRMKTRGELSKIGPLLGIFLLLSIFLGPVILTYVILKIMNRI